jgi:putative holliday junction resolvase
MPKIIALDYGTKRTGIAVTDDMQLIASGLTTVVTHHLLLFLKDYILKEQIAEIVIGEPKRMNNEPSSVTPHINGFIKQLQKLFPGLIIHRIDERFTSKMAFQSMIDSGLSKKQRQNKALVDEISATLLLQDFLRYNK